MVSKILVVIALVTLLFSTFVDGVRDGDNDNLLQANAETITKLPAIEVKVDVEASAVARDKPTDDVVPQQIQSKNPCGEVVARKNSTPDAAYVEERQIRRVKALRTYFYYNWHVSECSTKDCASGMNHCCSMCKIVKGYLNVSKLSATLNERIAEFSVGALFGGCALMTDSSDGFDGMSALQKLIEWHKAHPPTDAKYRNLETNFTIRHRPCPASKEKYNLEHAEYMGPLTRQALWEVRHEQPDLVPEMMFMELANSIRSMLSDDNYATLNLAWSSPSQTNMQETSLMDASPVRDPPQTFGQRVLTQLDKKFTQACRSQGGGGAGHAYDAYQALKNDMSTEQFIGSKKW